MSSLIIIRQTREEWEAQDIALPNTYLGVESNIVDGVETGSLQAKLFDGVHAWNELNYWNPSGDSGGVPPLDAPGEILVGTAGGTVVFPPGTDGQILTVDSDAPTGLAWVDASNQNSVALHFDRTHQQHVNHGIFWDRAHASAGLFLWEAWISPEGGAEYIISDGYGGAHSLLFGCLGGTPALLLGGNVSFENNLATVSFESLDHIYINEWHHVTVGWDGNYIRVYIDGVCSSATPATGIRQTINNPSEGYLGVGGSDHSNFNGFIHSMRGFEGWIPFALETPFLPQHAFFGAFNGNSNIAVLAPSFIADYSRSANPVPEISAGYTNGIRQVVTNTVVITSVTEGNAKSVVTAIGMSNSPKTVTYAVTNGESAVNVAIAARAALRADPDVGAFFSVGGLGVDVILAVINPAANDATMNVTIENATSGGIVDDTTAVPTTAGVLGERIQHPGMLANLLDAFEQGTFSSGLDNATTSQFENIPEYRSTTFAKATVYQGATASIPVGAIGYDDFSRVNVTWAWDDVLTLGTNRTGQVWENGLEKWGIIDSSAFSDNSAGVPAVAIFDLGKTTQDVTIHRTVADHDHLGPVPVLRYTDSDNYIYATHDGSAGIGFAQIAVLERVAGVPAFIIGFVHTGDNANDIRLTVSGTTVNLYIDGSGTPIGTGTTTVVSGTKVGMRSPALFTRIKYITAY